MRATNSWPKLWASPHAAVARLQNARPQVMITRRLRVSVSRDSGRPMKT